MAMMLPRAAAAAALALLVVLFVEGAQWLYADLANRRIRAGAVEDLADPARPELRFALAHALAAGGDHQRALAEYARVAESAHQDLAQAALFNSGNLYLRLAVEERAKGDDAQAMPLIELAKQRYRELLRTNPAHWDAKYNLERALRLAPDVDEADAAPLPPPPARERAATTMRGFTLGLP